MKAEENAEKAKENEEKAKENAEKAKKNEDKAKENEEDALKSAQIAGQYAKQQNLSIKYVWFWFSPLTKVLPIGQWSILNYTVIQNHWQPKQMVGIEKKK